MKCLSLSRLISYQNGLLHDIQHKQIESHLKSCSRCKRKIDAYEALLEFFRGHWSGGTSSPSNGCYDEFELVTYLEGDLQRQSRSKLHGHLAECQACLDKVVALESFLRELKMDGLIPTRQRFQTRLHAMVVVMIAAAKTKLRTLAEVPGLLKPVYGWLAVAIIFVALGLFLIRPLNLERLRLVTREKAPIHTEAQIEPLAPQNGGSVTEQYPEFRWVGPTDIAYYDFLLLDANGDIVWETTTSQNRLLLPKRIELQTTMTYFWQIEGRFAPGDYILSEMMSFTYDAK